MKAVGIAGHSDRGKTTLLERLVPEFASRGLLARPHERAARGDGDACAMAEESAAEFVLAWLRPLQQACATAASRFPAARVHVRLADLLGAAL